MLLANVCEGFIRFCYGEFWERFFFFFAFWLFFCVLCVWVVLVLLIPLLCTRLGLLRCASCWTRQAAHKTAHKYLCICLGVFIWKPKKVASAGQPSLHGNYAGMVYWTKEAHRRICRLKYGETSFFSFQGLSVSRNSEAWFWGLIYWYLWIGRARHLGLPSLPRHVGVEVLNVGGWLTHGDLALEVDVDFLAVVQHRLIPARVRS